MKHSIKKKKNSSICYNSFIRKNKQIEKTCKKVVSKLEKKAFRKKLLIGSIIFVLFNLAIILILSRKTLVYKLTKYFAKRILEGATPQEKEMIQQIQTHLPLVVDFVNKHSDNIKKIDNSYNYYSNMYNDFVNVIMVDEGKEYIMPGSFPSNDKPEEKDTKLQIKKLNEKEATKLIDGLIDDDKYFFYFF